MQTFEIKEEFLVDGKPTKLISGAIHYFRMTPAQWEDSLYNLKALGANTIETYIPWLDGDFAAICLYLCGMGIRRATCLVAERARAIAFN